MKKLSKLTAALLSLLMVMSLFAACNKDDDEKEEKKKKKEISTVEDVGGMIEITEEPEDVTENTAKIEFDLDLDEITLFDGTTVAPGSDETTDNKVPTSVAATTDAPTTKAPTTKAPTTKAPTTKAPTTKAPTTKAPTTKAPTTKAPTVARPTVPHTTKVPTTKAPTTKAPTTKAPTTKPTVTKPSNADLLIGTWNTTIYSEDVPVTVQFIFEKNGKLRMDFNKASYEKMIRHIVNEELKQFTDAELKSLGYDDREEAEEYFTEYFMDESTYNEMRNGILSTGTWNVSGDTLTITIDGGTASAQLKLNEGKNSFVLKDNSGETMTLTRA